VPRAIWSGNIAFGLVNVPVRMYSAIDEQDVRFHYLHVKDDSRIGYEKVCKKEGKPVPDDEIVKAYELRDGEYVYVTDEDFEAAQPESYKSIDIRDFVPYDEIDPIYFERTYYLGPADGSEKAYALLLRAMEDAGLAAIASYVMRDRQQLGCLRAREGVITLEKMYFADEIRPVEGIRPRKVSVGKAELRMAGDLIDKFTGTFDPTQYEDTYREALLDLIRRKQKGEIHTEPEPVEEEPSDLLSALKASVERHSRRTSGSRDRRRPAGSLDRLSKSELEDRAREAGIRGRSKMTKDELVDALRAAA
jgi:DNA end-binding protein Ku